MKLRRISIENFRSLPSLEIDVGRHLVLIGPNEAGKTSILHALHMLLGLPHARLLASLAILDFSDPGQALVIQASFDSLDDRDRAHFPDEIHIDQDGTETLTIRLECLIDAADPEARSVRRYCVGSSSNKQIARSQLDHIGWTFAHADRSFSHELGTAATGTFTRLISRLELGTERDDLVSRVQELQDQIADTAGLAKLRSNLATQLATILPSGYASDDLSLRTVADAEQSPLAGLLLYLRNSSGTLSSIVEQSDGFRGAALLSLLALADFGAGMSAIDEPELHLHPSAQKAIGQALASSPRQHFIATHSGHVASAFAPSDIFAVSRHRTVRSYVSRGSPYDISMTWRWWTSDLVEALTCERLLFVEGASDRILLHSAAHAAGLSLASKGIHILPLDGGGSFRRAFEILGPTGYAVPTSGLCDLDAQSNWAQILNLAVADLEAHQYFTCDPDLEGEVVGGLGAARFLHLLGLSQVVSAAEVMAWCTRNSRDATNVNDLAAYWRKHKTMVAIALAHTMEPSDVASLGAINRLLKTCTDA